MEPRSELYRWLSVLAERCRTLWFSSHHWTESSQCPWSAMRRDWDSARFSLQQNLFPLRGSATGAYPDLGELVRSSSLFGFEVSLIIERIWQYVHHIASKVIYMWLHRVKCRFHSANLFLSLLLYLNVLIMNFQTKKSLVKNSKNWWRNSNFTSTLCTFLFYFLILKWGLSEVNQKFKNNFQKKNQLFL